MGPAEWNTTSRQMVCRLRPHHGLGWGLDLEVREWVQECQAWVWAHKVWEE